MNGHDNKPKDQCKYKSKRKTAFFHMRRYHNFIKRKFIEQYRAETVLDLACGKGGDLQKYLDNGFNYIEGYDNDYLSITEANNRKEYFLERYPHRVINLFHVDLLKTVVKSSVKFDLVVCNFAFHYFFNSYEKIAQSIAENSKQGTVVLLTLLDKDKVKYTDTKNLKISNVGENKIEVYIKDSVLDEPRIEYLVPKDQLISLFKTMGFKLVLVKGFSDFYDEWMSCPNGKSLSYNEKKYSFMNNVYVFQKI